MEYNPFKICDQPAQARKERRQAIPRQIFQTFESRYVPEGMYRAAASWSRLNPEFAYRFFDDAARRTFLAENYGERIVSCYERLPRGAFRADLWRLCVLHKYGGVYADLDTVCMSPLSKLVAADDSFIIAHGVWRRALFNAFVCAVPQHPFLATAIARCEAEIMSPEFEELLARDPYLPLRIAGPRGLAMSVNLALGRSLTTKFRPGTYEIGGIRFRILRKFHVRPLYFRRVFDGARTVLLCKYPSYLRDLESAGGRHWKLS